MNSRFPLSRTFVRASVRPATVALALFVMCLPNVARAAALDMKANLDAITSMREAEIEMANKPLAEIRTKYEQALQDYQNKARTAGDLKGVLAATAALELLKSGTPFSPPSENPGIAKIQQTYQKSCGEIQKQTDARLLAVDRDYANQLDKLIKELTQAGSTEDAVKVREIKDRFIEDFKTAKAAKLQASAKADPARTQKSEGMRAGEERDFEITKGVKAKMCWIPPGEFMMGSPEGELGHRDDETQHRVTLTKGFWLGKYEVTQEQWQAVMENNPSDFKGKDLPVEKVLWNMIAGVGGFLEKANNGAREGEGFHLPTEAQWEYACRAGTQSSLNNGKDITTAAGECRNLNAIAWYRANSDATYHPVGGKKANAWGLYDMHGNVWEWCQDWEGVYPTGPVTDPRGPDSGQIHVIRGGSWEREPNRSRSAVRSHSPDGGATGFRLARSSAP